MFCFVFLCLCNWLSCVDSGDLLFNIVCHNGPILLHINYMEISSLTVSCLTLKQALFTNVTVHIQGKWNHYCTAEWCIPTVLFLLVCIDKWVVWVESLASLQVMLASRKWGIGSNTDFLKPSLNTPAYLYSCRGEVTQHVVLTVATYIVWFIWPLAFCKLKIINSQGRFI